MQVEHVVPDPNDVGVNDQTKHLSQISAELDIPEIEVEPLQVTQVETQPGSSNLSYNSFDEDTGVSQEINSRYGRLIMCSSGVVFELDPSGRILEINDAIARIAGYSPQELIGKNWWQVFWKTNPEQSELIKASLASSDVAGDEWVITTKRGDRITLEVNTASQYSSSGELQRILGFGIDVTKRKRAEEQLRQSEVDITDFEILKGELMARLQDLEKKEEELRFKNEELARTQEQVDQERRRYQDLFEFAPDGYLVTDADGTIQEANRVAASLLQIHRTELPGKNLIEFIIPNEREFYSRELRYLNEGEKIRGWETNLTTKGGSFIQVAIIGASDSENVGKTPVFRWLLHNISQLKKAEATLREQKNILQSVLTCMSDAVIVTDNQGKLLTYNPAAEELLHLEPYKHKLVESWSTNYRFYLSDGETPCPEEKTPLASALKGDDIGSIELYLKMPSPAESRWLLCSVRHWKDENRQVGGGVVVLHDNTERKRVERAYLESEERYRYFVETAEEGIWVIDEEARTTLVNRKIADMLGYSVDEMLGTSYYDYMDEEGRKESAIHLERRRQGIREHHDFKFRRRDGTELWTSLATAPLYNAEGKYAGALKLVFDITERRKAEQALRESEERYRMVIEAVQDYAIFTLDTEGNTTSWNAGAETMHGYKAEEVLGSGLSHFYSPEAIQRGEPLQALKQASEQGRCEVEALQARKNGTRFWANLVLTALRKPNGDLRGFSVVMRDITRLKEAQEALLRQTGFVKLLQEIAIAANEAKSYLEVIQTALTKVCEHTGWQVGHAYSVRRDSTEQLVSLDLWHLDEPRKFSSFKKASQHTRLVSGKGLAGIIYQQKEPLWIQDITKDSRFLRSTAARRSGLNTAVGFPVLAGKEVVGILEFFSNQSIQVDEPLLEVMKHIGTQLGRVAERELSQEELRKSELRFRTMFEGAGMGVALVDLHGTILEFNPATASILGYTQEEFLHAVERRSIRLTSIISGIDEFHELRSRKRDSLLVEKQLSRKDGEIVWVRLSVTLARHPQEELQYAIAMIEDISGRRQMEVELSELQRRLVEWLDLQRVQLAKELHDGPLQDMIGLLYHLQVLRQEYREDESGLADLQKSLQKVTRTLKSICGELRPPTLSSFGLEKAIRSHASIIQENHPELDLQLVLASDELTLPERTRLGLYRIYQQALTNVLQHAQASEVRVSLKLEPDEVILEIEDDGKGFIIPSRWIDIARHGQLGLVGAAERAEAIGGRLRVESTRGLGTLVRVTVPLYENEPPVENS